MRIDRKTDNANLPGVVDELIAAGAVIDVLTSDLETYVITGLRHPTVIYRPTTESNDHIWLECPVISAESFDVAMDKFNAHWSALMTDPAWQAWVTAHPVPADVLAA
jgi:hypothetical protein